MPIYGYVCEQCGAVTEVLQGFNDAPLKTCPECMGPVRKQFYPAGVIFKGSGFYTTDYKAKPAGSNGGSGESSKTETKSEGKGEAKTEAKPEKKSESKASAE
jgi:putative FmdB family regulatory protein